MQILLPRMSVVSAPGTSQCNFARRTMSRWLVGGLLDICRLLSLPFATLHCCLVYLRQQPMPACIAQCRAGTYATLRDIWASRVWGDFLSQRIDRNQLRIRQLVSQLSEEEGDA